VAEFRDRTLAAQDFPSVFLDATYCKARVGHRIVSQAIVVAVGVAADGRREVLGFDVGDSLGGDRTRSRRPRSSPTRIAPGVEAEIVRLRHSFTGRACRRPHTIDGPGQLHGSGIVPRTPRGRTGLSSTPSPDNCSANSSSTQPATTNHYEKTPPPKR
jgi:Transposase, Mutator family